MLSTLASRAGVWRFEDIAKMIIKLQTQVNIQWKCKLWTEYLSQKRKANDVSMTFQRESTLQQVRVIWCHTETLKNGYNEQNKNVECRQD